MFSGSSKISVVEKKRVKSKGAREKSLPRPTKRRGSKQGRHQWKKPAAVDSVRGRQQQQRQ